MSRWVVVLDMDAVEPQYLRTDGGCTADPSDAAEYYLTAAPFKAARGLRILGYPRAGVAALPPAQAEGDPTAQGTR